ncbi:hypothetical protein [Flectobacillus longus]|uniref:hypothetical protein n=1 Tax=Flectobacillus longus TaxID=2984207 RepID=UPI0024B6B97A|nr:hypothetical protein [Flectobacillus longus]MDI9879237.1 hypothetical protein [Flectobacillus longus]
MQVSLLIKYPLMMGLLAMSFLWGASQLPEINLQAEKTFNLDSLGAGQGISRIGNQYFAYGDREIGVIREYKRVGDSLAYQHKEIALSIDGQDVIGHPTGIAYHKGLPTFIGNSVRLNPEGTQWKAVIYQVDWKGLQTTKKLDNNLISTIDDDACIQGTRPEYVQYKKQWYVATADYGNRKNEVRLYNPLALAKAQKTSEKGVLYKKFSCGAFVQNLLWIPEKKILVLIQNQIEGRRWRFSFLDFEKSIETGEQVVLKTIDIDKADELEGFTLSDNPLEGFAVTSSRRMNTTFIRLQW